VQTLLCGHCLREHVQANGTGQLGLERVGGHGNLGIVRDGLLRRTVKLVQGQVPRTLDRVRGRHGEDKRGRNSILKGIASSVLIYFAP
jgi:hypothetical protein